MSSVNDYAYTGNDLYPSSIVSSYDGGVCQTTITTTITKNNQGWITTIIANRSSSGTAAVRNNCTPGQSSQATSTYTYDTNGNFLTISSVTQGSSIVYTTTYTYDSSGRVTSITSSQGGSTTYTYNASGQLTSSVTVSGSTTSTTTYSY